MRVACWLAWLAACSAPSPVPERPEIAGDWWQIAGQPDLGAFSDPGQQPVDFTIWQAADGTWQLQSCIRFTLCGGNTRLFYRWEAQHLTDGDWTPVGIAMQAEPLLGETAGGLQAPFVLNADGVYHMFYGDWEHICHATSSDGKSFTRVIGPDGWTGMFSEGAGANTRDPMVLRAGDHFNLYDSAFVPGGNADFVRTTKDFVTWSDSTVASIGGAAGSGGSSAECPFVVGRDGWFYLFRTQRYGQDAQTTVYRSPDPLDFGRDDDRYLLEMLPVAAPEIVVDQGQWYIASLLPDLHGIRLARLTWSRAP
jgi:hypothetical protein